MEVKMYNQGIQDIATGITDWSSSGDVIKVVLMTNDYNFDEADADYDDLTNEITGGNYTTGGHALTLITPVVITAEDRVILDANDLTIANLVNTFRKLAIVNTYWSPVHLICFIDLGENIVSNGDYTFVWNNNGFVDIMAKTS